MNTLPSGSTASVLVVGAGIAGMQAALDLAATGRPVVLLERSAAIGGNMTRLDKTFPTNDCSMCMISPKMVACARHPNIRIVTLGELLHLEGEPGAFRATVKQHPRYVDETLCIGCGQCVDKCPQKVPNAYNGGLDDRKAVHFLYPQAIPMVPSIDPETCLYLRKGRCRACEKTCPVKAVCLESKAREWVLEAGAVVLSGGFEPALVPQAGEYGHGRYANVVTGLEYERMLSATGPFGGHPRRPSDRQKPRRTAWIQCVASRDSARRRNFCSSICCMAAVKQAVLTRDHDSESEAVIFFMDIRAQGKDFDRYVLRAKDQYGVRFVRSMPSRVIWNPVNDNLVIEYFDRTGFEHRREEFDLVVLSAGMKPSSNIAPLLESLGLQLNSYGFVTPDLERPCHTSREGIYVCGTLDGPRDIPESVAGGSAAAACAAGFLALRERALAPLVEFQAASSDPPASIPNPEGTPAESAPNLPETLPSSPPGDPAGEPPRIGVFICHCGRNIAGVLDVEALRDFASSLPHVTAADSFLFTCSTQTQNRIRELIEKRGLNRVVVAACSPRTHEPLFRETLQRAGLNPYLFEMANIRDQCSWVHGSDPEAATAKARQLIQAATARATLLEPVFDVATPVVRRALVLGAGLAGMTAALNLADQGIPVLLVEKEPQPGGAAREIYRTLEGLSPRRMAGNLSLRVKTHRNIHLFTRCSLEAVSGAPGHFTGILRRDGVAHRVEFGAVLVATGGRPYRPSEHFYGQDPRVLTQLDLEKRLFEDRSFLPGTTVMLQCVGSRRDDFPLCSRVCCAAAVKNAVGLMERNPRGAVYVLYRDIRTFGFKEEYYKKARDLGVLFVRFGLDSPPEVERSQDGSLRVRIPDASSRMGLEIRPDLLVLSGGIRPGPDTPHIAKILRLPLTSEGFFMEAHPKLSPLDFSTAGIFLCGLAHSPRFVEESLAQAAGAAARAAGLLAQKEVLGGGTVAEVIPERCSGCLACVTSCPYEVPRVDARGVSTIDPRKCKGCGTCVAECPAKAIDFRHYTDRQVVAQVAGLARSPASEPRSNDLDGGTTQNG